MDNSVNNNLNNNVTSNANNGGGQSTGVTGSTVIQPTQVVNTTQPVTPVTTVQSQQTVATNSNNTILGQQNNTNVSKKDDTNTYLIVGLFVGFILLAAVFLLVLLVTGVIGNRNRLTCTKTVTENGYTYYSERLYILEKGVYTRVENTDVFTYTALTDEIFDQKFGPIIEIKSGVTEYGFGTVVNREENVVTITSYYPNFFGYNLDKVKADNNESGYTCK